MAHTAMLSQVLDGVMEILRKVQISNEAVQEVDPPAAAAAVPAVDEPLAEVRNDLPLTRNEINEIKESACSAQNFSVKLVLKVFSVEELENRNVNGRQGREKLSTEKMKDVKDMFFSAYSPSRWNSAAEKENQWGNCVRAIDAYLRKRKFQLRKTDD